MRRATPALALLLLALAGCGDDDSDSEQTSASTQAKESPAKADAPKEVDKLIDIGGRKLHYRCSGSGSPTVFFERGDGDDIQDYGTSETDLTEVTRTCTYSRAGLGRSDPAKGPRQLDDLTDDLEKLLTAAKIESPIVLVGSSGGGYIAAEYTRTHPDDIAGLVLVDTFPPFTNPPPGLIEETAWDNPANTEQRDYLQVEKDAWKRRKKIGDLPVRVVTATYPDGAENYDEKNSKRLQKGWLVLSSDAKQVLAKTSHEIENEDPDLLSKTILEVVEAVR